MHGMTESTLVQRINNQCASTQPRERYRHLPTKKRYVLILEAGGACELQGVDMHCIHQSRHALNDTNIWERLP